MREKKRKHPLLIILLILLALLLILGGTVFGLWMHGQNSMKQDAPPPALPEDLVDSDSSDIVEYQGKRYHYNKNMQNILLMGIDSDEDPDQAAGGNYEQADVLVLAALNQDTNQMTLISISRDTMCDIQILNQNGAITGLMNTQLALAYAYGDGQTLSCEATRDAVSNIFYGLPIQGYAAYYMNGIHALNHAVGGVTVTILDDYPFTSKPEGKNMVAGNRVKLTDKQALLYIRARVHHQVNANELRMKRQKQYMLELLSITKQMVKENPSSVLELYKAVDKYILTNLDIGEVAYLSTKAAGMDFSGDLRSLAGSFTLSKEGHAEYHLDKDALFKLMLEIFYTELPPEATAPDSSAS